MFNPVNKVIFMEPDKKPSRNAQGLWLQDGGEPESVGTVLSSASELCKPGDRIVAQGFNVIYVDGVQKFVTTESKVLAVEPKEEAEQAAQLKVQQALMQGTPAGQLVN